MSRQSKSDVVARAWSYLIGSLGFRYLLYEGTLQGYVRAMLRRWCCCFEQMMPVLEADGESIVNSSVEIRATQRLYITGVTAVLNECYNCSIKMLDNLEVFTAFCS